MARGLCTHVRAATDCADPVGSAGVGIVAGVIRIIKKPPDQRPSPGR
jgi:hypothetical protein